jgi:hypothetical protein
VTLSLITIQSLLNCICLLKQRSGDKCFQFLYATLLDVSRGSSVSIVSGYGLEDRAIEFRSPREAKGFFL